MRRRLVQVETERYPDQDAAVHEEVNRLPEKYRVPVVLCDLEGRTHQEAARFLGWPIGTVKSRQSQGRGLLRDQLVRRGVGLGVAGAVVESMAQASFAGMPPQVSESIAHAAMVLTARGLAATGASARVLTLTQGVFRAMLWARLRVVAVAAIGIGIASGGTFVVPARGTGAGEEGRTLGIQGHDGSGCAGSEAEGPGTRDGRDCGGADGSGDSESTAVCHAKGQGPLRDGQVDA